MAIRRLEKISKLIQTTVSEVIQNELSDPRMEGLVSVTRVETAADLRSAKVFVSVYGAKEGHDKLVMDAIQGAHGYIQSFLAEALTIRTCPTLSFHLDESLKKSFEVMQIINKISAEQEEKDRRARGQTEEAEEEPDAGVAEDPAEPDQPGSPDPTDDRPQE